MENGGDSFEIGIRILRALPRLTLGGKKFFCIVDGLEYAEDWKTEPQVREFVRALRDVIAWNNGQLVYTLTKGVRTSLTGEL